MIQSTRGQPLPARPANATPDLKCTGYLSPAPEPPPYVENRTNLPSSLSIGQGLVALGDEYSLVPEKRTRPRDI